jgi:hypothetical protein
MPQSRESSAGTFEPIENTDRATRTHIRRAQSCAAHAREAVREFHAGVTQPQMALVIFFCSNEYDLAVLADEMARLFEGVQVAGCTTAGEFGPAGYRQHSISGASFPAASFTTSSGRIERLQQFEIVAGQVLVQGLLQELESHAPQVDSENSFALLLIDGLSVREEPVARALQNALGKIPLVGGSAGDGLDFGATHIYSDGRFHSDCAVLILVTTPLPFKLFQTQHFVAADQRVVVTGADAEHRLVIEIDGRPAARAYADLVRVDVDNLDPMRFAASPMVVVIGGINYVRSIRSAHADGSLSFFCAIDEGMVLRVAHGTNLMDNLEQTFVAINAAIGEPQLVIACDCVLRRLEIVQSGLVAAVEDAFRRNNVTGFNSYGEQYRGVHLNQTLAGIAIGHGTVEVKGG